MERKERRLFTKPVELRAVAGDDGGQVFSGYVFEWNSLSQDMGGFVERVQRGATLSAVTGKKNIFATLDHQLRVEKILGDRDTKTLRLFEDDRGFGFEISAGPTTAARDAAIVAGRNAIGVSLAFVCGQDRWTLENDQRVRDIVAYEEIEEISLVVDPAYRSSDVTVARRSLQAIEEQEKKTKGPSVEYLRHRLELTCFEAGIPCESRENPHHDEDGKFHDGAPGSILSTARGRMAKAEQRHLAACAGPEEHRAVCRAAHADAIASAKQAIQAADSVHTAMVQEHRAAIAASTAKHQELVAAGKQPPTPTEPSAPIGAETPAV